MENAARMGRGENPVRHHVRTGSSWHDGQPAPHTRFLIVPGNNLALPFLAELLSRSSHLQTANALWGRFFKHLDAIPDDCFRVASRGELLHRYIVSQLRRGLEPEHLPVLCKYRCEIAAHH